MIERIPVYLLTGFLGSGKTTLLARWLNEPPLRDAALIVNEIGAVGLDHATLGYAGDASALLADACVCCTGLPGLHEALENLFWARLHRSVARFGSVAIETTGLADPRPLAASLSQSGIVNQRYSLAGIVTTLGAPTALRILASFDEARAQVKAADVIVVTKTDLVTRAQLNEINRELWCMSPTTRVLFSSQGSLDSDTVLHELALSRASKDAARMNWQATARPRTGSGFAQRGRIVHNAATRFEAIDDAHDIDTLNTRLSTWITQHGAALLRMKGVVRTTDGSLVVVQFTCGDRQPTLTAANEATLIATRDTPNGVTLIVRTS